MSFLVGTLGELLIIQAFVLFIWLRVLFETIKYKDEENKKEFRRVLLTSIGLVFNAVSVIGLIGFRLHEYIEGNWPFVAGLSAFYGVQAAGGILFIITASFDNKLTTLRLFTLATAIWTFIVFGTNYIV